MDRSGTTAAFKNARLMINKDTKEVTKRLKTGHSSKCYDSSGPSKGFIDRLIIHRSHPSCIVSYAATDGARTIMLLLATHGMDNAMDGAKDPVVLGECLPCAVKMSRLR